MYLNILNAEFFFTFPLNPSIGKYCQIKFLFNLKYFIKFEDTNPEFILLNPNLALPLARYDRLFSLLLLWFSNRKTENDDSSPLKKFWQELKCKSMESSSDSDINLTSKM